MRIHQTGGKYAGILWYQGCSDTNPEPASQYLEHFRAYAEAERADEEEQKSFQLEGNGIWLKLTFAHVKNCFLVYSALGKDSGFTLTDRQGEVEILHIRGNRENKNHLYLELAREAEDEAELSFAWQADPVKQPPIIDLSIIIVEVLCIF